MIGLEGASTLIVTALTGITFVAALVLTLVIGRRLHRDWLRLATSGPPAWVAPGRDSAAVLVRDAERRRDERANEEVRLHHLRAESAVWEERLDLLRRQTGELDARFQEITALKAEASQLRAEQQGLCDALAGMRTEHEGSVREAALRREEALALGVGLEQDRRLAGELAAGLAEAWRWQGELAEAETATRRELTELQAELARCREAQDVLCRDLGTAEDAGRSSLEGLEAAVGRCDAVCDALGHGLVKLEVASAARLEGLEAAVGRCDAVCDALGHGLVEVASAARLEGLEAAVGRCDAVCDALGHGLVKLEVASAARLEGLEAAVGRCDAACDALGHGLVKLEVDSQTRLQGFQEVVAHCLDEHDALRHALAACREDVAVVEEPEPAVSVPLPPEPRPESIPSVPFRRRTVRWTRVVQSVVKPRNDSFLADGQTVWRRNEDRFRLCDTTDGLLAAVSDGAGASGLFCGAWAEALVRHLPERPLTGLEDLNTWLDGFCLDFHRTFAEQAKADARKHSKFVREGSFATLAACWLERRGGEVWCRWLAYGDSPLLVFDRSGGDMVLVAGHPESLGAFDRDPQLLNWKTLPMRSAVKTGEMRLPEHATIVLASDGIGQYVLLRFLAALPGAPGGLATDLLAEFRRLAEVPGSRVGTAIAAHLAKPVATFGEELADLADCLTMPSAFAALVAARCDDGRLANDDATLIVINVDGSDACDGPDAVDQR